MALTATFSSIFHLRTSCVAKVQRRRYEDGNQSGVVHGVFVGGAFYALGALGALIFHPVSPCFRPSAGRL